MISVTHSFVEFVPRLHILGVPVNCVIWPLDSFIKAAHLATRWTFSLSIRSGASLPEELPFLAGGW